MIRFSALYGWCRLSLGAVVATVAILAFGAPVAGASKGVLATFGQEGTGAGEFEWPGGVAVNQTSGDVYVADVFDATGGNRIEQFSADGDFIRAWGWGVATGANAFEICTTGCQPGIAGSGDGQFSFQFQNSATDPQIAIDQSDGSVYVADTFNDRVQKFSASGAFTGTFGSTGTGDGQFVSPQGIAVDPVTQDVYVGDGTSADLATVSNRVQRFSSSGVFQSQVGSGSGSEDGQFLDPVRLAVDSTGRLYVLDRGNARLQRFTDAGAFDQVFAAGVVGGPSDVAVDPATDHVFIPGYTSDFSGTGIFEFAGDGTPVDTHAANSGVLVDLLGGLAVRSSTGRIYASEQVPRRVLILDDVAPPTVSIDPVSDVTAHAAVFHGSVNPQGLPGAGYRFEYSTDGASWTPLPSPDAPVGSGTTDVVVSQTATGLDANTEYRVRLVVTKDFNSGTATSSEVTFATDAAPPLVRSLAAGARTDTSAWLGGEVNPQNSATEYFVEYTLAADAGYADSSRVPAAPDGVDAGAGNAFVTAMQLATGLKPNTTYRFRLVATNVAGTTEGPDGTFATNAALPEPPPGRGYEMVSPQDKNGAEIDRNLPTGIASTSGAGASGDQVAFAALGQFAGINSGAPQGQYRSERTDTGWVTRGISPPVETYPVNEVLSPSMFAFSDDLSSAIVGTNASVTPDTSLLGGSWGLYRQDNDVATSSYELLSVPFASLSPEPPQALFNPDRVLRFTFASASRDLSHVVFVSTGRQLTSDGPVTDGQSVYEWTGGEVRFISELPSGDPAQQPSPGAQTFNGQYYPGDHVVSDDGERVFFTDIGTLYVREHGAGTRTVSVSEQGSGPPTPGQGVFQAATADGSRALFLSSSRLTDDATACDSGCPGGVAQDLYLWDGTAPEGEQLTDLTTGDATGGGVLGLAAATDDFSRAFFVATGALAPGAVAGTPNLYRWSAASGLDHVATLSALDEPVWGTERDPIERQFRDARLTGDGGRLLFTSHARLTAADNEGHKQVYLYDNVADRLVCVSCKPDGSAADGDAWLFYPPDLGDEARAPYRLPRNLSADGRRAFFETTQGLVDADTNGKADVYMWADGQPSLVSSGRSDEKSEFVDASASGNDVFFTTRERLVGFDGDNEVDVYDARVGGGFAEQAKPIPCVGDRCQGPFAQRPVLPAPSDGSASGDPVIPKRASFTVAKLSAKARSGLARGKAVPLVVRVNKAGRIVVRGTARVGKRSKTVLTSAKRARSAGKVRLTLRLSKLGRQRLAEAGRMRMSLSVRFSGVREPKVLSLGLVRASKRGGDR